MKRAAAAAVRPIEGHGYDSHVSNFGLSSWISTLLYHYTTEMKLRVNENFTIDSIDELRQSETKKNRNKYKK